MATSTLTLTRPLVLAGPALKQTPVKEFVKGQQVGQLLILGRRRQRDGHFVYKSGCRCGQPNCVGEADVDERLLSSLNTRSKACPLQTNPSLVPYKTWLRAVRAARIQSENAYRQALKKGVLIPGSPIDPTVYPEWVSWAEVTGNPDCHSSAELLAFLKTMQSDCFTSMPEIERYKILSRQRRWVAIEQKAKEMGIARDEIIARLPEIIAALEMDALPFDYDGDDMQEEPVDRPSRERAEKEKEYAFLDPTQLQSRIAWEVQAYHGDISAYPDLLTGWLMDLWNSLDREDVLHGNGFRRLQPELNKLKHSVPKLVERFYADYEGVKLYKTRARNWMQAYACWYAVNNRTWLNFSEPGIGKTRTIPIIVSTLDIKLTVLIAPARLVAKENSQIPDEIALEDDRAIIHYIGDGLPDYFKPGYHHYLFINPERFQQRGGTAMVDGLLALRPGLIVIDEIHLLCAKESVEEGNIEQFDDHPRSRELFRFIYGLDGETARVGLLTGTPIRTDPEEASTILSFLGVESTVVKGDLLATALDLRSKFQLKGFRFYNYKLPELEQYLVWFNMPTKLADELNDTDASVSYLDRESLRIPYALEAIQNMATSKVYKYDGKDFRPVISPPGDLLARAINPVFYTWFISGEDGPVQSIRDFIKLDPKARYYHCTGTSPETDLAAYQNNKDGMLIASSCFGNGINGAHYVSDTIVILGLPWTYAGLVQLTARIRRQGATKPNGTPTKVVLEIIPVAANLEYDVRRFFRVYKRREFSDCLLDGRIPRSVSSSEGDLKHAFDDLLSSLPKKL